MSDGLSRCVWPSPCGWIQAPFTAPFTCPRRLVQHQVGAVSSAVLKGTQLILVFCISFVFYCRFEVQQCFSWRKAAGVLTVAAGLVVFARSVRAGPGREDRDGGSASGGMH